jgi:hypothetical protein
MRGGGTSGSISTVGTASASTSRAARRMPDAESSSRRPSSPMAKTFGTWGAALMKEAAAKAEQKISDWRMRS